MEKVSLGVFIYNRRKELGLSLKDIADFLIVSPSTVYKWEKDERMPDLSLFGNLAKVLKVDLESLIDSRSEINNNYDLENEFDITRFSKYFSIQRKLNNYTLQTLSEKLNISYQTISKWEKQESLPNIYTLKECSELFHISLVELYYGKNFYTVEQNTKELKKHKKKSLLYILGSVVLVLAVSLGVIIDKVSNGSNPSNVYSSPSLEVSETSSIEDSSTLDSSSSIDSSPSIGISDDFVVEETDRGLRLIKYNGNDLNINIPDGINIIGTKAFSKLNFREIALPNSLMEIEDSAFENCAILEKVIMGDNVEVVGEYAFANCMELTDINLSNNLIELGQWSFKDCTSLKEIKIPGKVKIIKQETFLNCVSLQKIELSEGLEVIDKMAFLDLRSLDSINIPKTVIKIGDTSFSGTAIKEIIIPSNVKIVDNYAFYNCEKLETMYIEEGVLFLGNSFVSSPNLKSISIPESVEYFGGIEVSDLLEYNIYDDCYYLGSENNKYKVFVFPIDKTKEKYNIHEKTTFLNQSAFANCENLKDFNIPSQITQICSYAFSNCNSITNVIIHENIKEIGYRAFADCKKMESITVKEGLQTIMHQAFSGCSELSNVSLSQSIKYIGNQVFSECDNIVYNKYDTGLYLGDDDNKFRYFIRREDENIETCMIHSNTVIISCGAFWKSYKLKEIEIPEGITYLGVNLFSCCDKLERIILPASIQMIEGYAISDCSNLKEVCFKGTKEQWENIDIHEFEIEKISSINIIYNYQN